jgi:hypothetical protein
MNSTLPPEFEVEARGFRQELRGSIATHPSDSRSAPSRVGVTHKPPSPKHTVNVLLAAILLGAVFLDYWQYSRNYHAQPTIYLDVIAGNADAPAQYRIGVVDPAHFLAVHTHLPLRDWLTAIDFVSAFAACFLLLFMLRRSRAYAAAGLTGQWLAELAFVVLLQFNLAWLIWYQRPETLPTAALLALGLLFLSVPIGGDPVRPILGVAGILGVTAAQSFVRPDVVFAFNLGVLMLCVFRARPSFVLPRRLQIGVSVVGVCIALTIQWILMRQVFPHATYGETQVFQFVSNLKSVSGYLPFLTIMLPVGWAIWRVATGKGRVPGPQFAMLIGACIFACMWGVVGITQEVRIFLPYGLVLIPTLVTLLLGMVPGLTQDAYDERMEF